MRFPYICRSIHRSFFSFTFRNLPNADISLLRRRKPQLLSVSLNCCYRNLSFSRSRCSSSLVSTTSCLDEFKWCSENYDFSRLDENSFKLSLEHCRTQLASLSNSQLEILLHNIIRARSKFTSSDEILTFTEAIDNELAKRAVNWSTEELLVYFRLLIQLPKLKRSAFTFCAVKHRHKNFKLFKNNKEVVVEFIRLLNERNAWSIYHVPKYNYEQYLYFHLSELSSDDLEVFMEFIIRARLLINTPNLFQLFCQRIIDELPNLSPKSLVYFCQFILARRSFGWDLPTANAVTLRLSEYFVETDYINVDAYTAVARLCSYRTMLSKQFYMKFGAKISEHVNDYSLSTLFSALDALTYFDEQSIFTAVYDRVVNHLRLKSKTDFQERPESFILTMYYLSRVGIFPFDLLDFLFSQKFLSRAYPKGLTKFPLRERYVIGQELVTIDGGIEIECPDYKGNRLEPKAKHTIERYYCWRLPAVSNASHEDLNKTGQVNRKPSLTTKLALQRILGGAEFVHTCFLLPHLPRPNLLFALSKDGKPQQLSASIREKMIVDRSILDEDLHWYTLSIYCASPLESQRSSGTLRAEDIPKVRQLEKLGFRVVKTMLSEWLDKNDHEIEQSLHNKIFLCRI